MEDDLFDAALAEHEAELLADSRAVAAAVYAEVGIIDRFRAAQGFSVSVEVGGLGVSGRVAECAADGVVIEDAGTVWVIPLGAVIAVRGLPAEHLPPTGVLQRRVRLPMLIRRHCQIGAPVELGMPQRRIRGHLLRVGADHVECRGAAGPEVLALPWLQWLSCPVAPAD